MVVERMRRPTSLSLGEKERVPRGSARCAGEADRRPGACGSARGAGALTALAGRAWPCDKVAFAEGGPAREAPIGVVGGTLGRENPGLESGRPRTRESSRARGAQGAGARRGARQPSHRPGLEGFVGGRRTGKGPLGWPGVQRLQTGPWQVAGGQPGTWGLRRSPAAVGRRPRASSLLASQGPFSPPPASLSR